MFRLDSTGQTLDHSSSSNSLEESICSYCSSDADDCSEDVGCSIDVDIPDGRLSTPAFTKTMLQISPLDGTSDHYTIRLVTNHHSFSLGRSVSIRTINSLYFIQKSLKDLHPYVNIPSLPPKFIFSMFSSQKQCKIIAKFLQQVLSIREYLSNKAVHLFLQTNLTLEKIKLNIEGVRDDDVPAFPIVDKRDNLRNGFSEIFSYNCNVIDERINIK